MNLFDLFESQILTKSDLKEFAPGDGSGQGRWYTDDQMIDIVGPDWAPEHDQGHLTLEQQKADAQAWLDDQGYSVVVQNVEHNPEGGYRWQIYGEFFNPRFAPKEAVVPKTSVTEAQEIRNKKGTVLGTWDGTTFTMEPNLAQRLSQEYGEDWVEQWKQQKTQELQQSAPQQQQAQGPSQNTIKYYANELEQSDIAAGRARQSRQQYVDLATRLLSDRPGVAEDSLTEFAPPRGGDGDESSWPLWLKRMDDKLQQKGFSPLKFTSDVGYVAKWQSPLDSRENIVVTLVPFQRQPGKPESGVVKILTTRFEDGKLVTGDAKTGEPFTAKIAPDDSSFKQINLIITFVIKSRVEPDSGPDDLGEAQAQQPLIVARFTTYDLDNWYVKGTPDVIGKFIMLANSIEQASIAGSAYDPETGSMGQIHGAIGTQPPQWKKVDINAADLTDIDPITASDVNLLRKAKIEPGDAFISDFLWDLEAAGRAKMADHMGDAQGLAEGSDLKKQISKYEELALAANRAGDDQKCKMYQQKIQKLKDQQNKKVQKGVAEAGPFSYGAKKSRKGSVADLAAKKRKEQEKGKQPIEPSDQMVGVAKVTKGVAEGYEPGDKITWYHSNHFPEIEGTVVGWKDGHLIVTSVDPSPRNTEKTVTKYRVPKNNIMSHTKQGVAEGLEDLLKIARGINPKAEITTADQRRERTDQEMARRAQQAADAKPQPLTDQQRQELQQRLQQLQQGFDRNYQHSDDPSVYQRHHGTAQAIAAIQQKLSQDDAARSQLEEAGMKDISIEYEDWQRMTDSQFLDRHGMTKDDWMLRNRRLFQVNPHGSEVRQREQDKLRTMLAKNQPQTRNLGLKIAAAPGSKALAVGNFKQFVNAYERDLPDLVLFYGNEGLALNKKDIDTLGNYYNKLQREEDKKYFIYEIFARYDKLFRILVRLGLRTPEQIKTAQPEPAAQGSLFEKQSKDIKDTQLSRALKQARSQFPTASTDIEAFLKMIMANDERDQKTLDRIDQTNQKQTDLLKKIQNIDQQQSQEIEQLGSENNDLESQLNRLDQVNKSLERAISNLAPKTSADQSQSQPKVSVARSAAAPLLPPVSAPPVTPQTKMPTKTVSSKPAAAVPAGDSRALGQMVTQLTKPSRPELKLVPPANDPDASDPDVLVKRMAEQMSRLDRPTTGTNTVIGETRLRRRQILTQIIKS